MDNYNQQKFSGYSVVENSKVRADSAVSKKFMSSVFAWMFLALGLSAIISVVFSNLFLSDPAYLQYFYNITESGARPSIIGWVTIASPLVFVLTMSFAFARLSARALTLLFILYAVVNGISFSFIMLTFTAGSIIGCFASASAMFGIMALMGYTTDKDLTSFGSILSMGLVGMLVAIMVNMFIGSEMLDYIISMVGVAVFTGLTAYDVQKLKRISAGIEYNGTPASDTRKIAIMGALTLYLDFANLFLMLLRLFGNRK